MAIIALQAGIWRNLRRRTDVYKRQKIACLEGIAYRNGWITADKLRALAEPMLRNQYGQYLLKLLDEK